MQAGNAPDVMRGEETQIAGALALMPALQASARLVLPGTHSKWVRIEGGRIQGFTTYMTGEVYAVLSPIPSSAVRLLRRSRRRPPGCVRARRGRGAGAPRGLAPLLFTARSLVLTGQLRPAESLDYLSGLLIARNCAAPCGTGTGRC